MKSFAEQRMADVAKGESGGAKPYEAANNHCFSFAMEVANAAGIQTNVSGAEYLDVKIEGVWGIRNLVDNLVPNFEVPARQMRELQKRYTKLNVTSSWFGDWWLRFPKEALLEVQYEATYLNSYISIYL